MYDLLLLAFQTDTTRVATFMLANEGSNRVYKSIGLNEGHHQMSHHRNDPDKVAQARSRSTTFLVEQFSTFLGRLRDGQGGRRQVAASTRSPFVYGCARSATATATATRTCRFWRPAAGPGRCRPGRHVRFDETPTTNLFLSLADRMGRSTTSNHSATAPGGWRTRPEPRRRIAPGPSVAREGVVAALRFRAVRNQPVLAQHRLLVPRDVGKNPRGDRPEPGADR